MKRRLFIGSWKSLFLMLCVFAVHSHGQTIRYIRAGAVGARDGSDWSDAYPALPATLIRGAIYYVADGTYGGYTFDDATSGTALITIRKATVDDHGTATGWQDSYGDGQAIFGGLKFD